MTIDDYCLKTPLCPALVTVVSELTETPRLAHGLAFVSSRDIQPTLVSGLQETMFVKGH